jgi:hypothetical protein
MKIAEALALRAEMQNKVAKLRERLGRSALIQEGDTASLDPEKLLAECGAVIAELYALVARINRTNASVRLPDGQLMVDAIAERDRLKQQIALLSFAATCAVPDKQADRYSPREIKWIAKLEVAKLHKQADDLSSKLREINSRIQEANWSLLLGD